MEYLGFDPLNDGKSRIELIDYMGGDLSIVNDARASFDKSSKFLAEKDTKLIKYLIDHKHFSPFRGVTFKFKIKAPLFVCRQWWKHTIASSHNDDQIGWNEKSFRYTTINESDEFYIPETFRQQSKNNKQATEGELSDLANTTALNIYKAQCERSYVAYKRLLELGVGREQARGILVPSVYTSWVWTTSFQAVMNFVELRLGEGSQNEIKKYAERILDLITPLVPVSVQYWMENNDK